MTKITAIFWFNIYSKYLFKLDLHGVKIHSNLSVKLRASCGDGYKQLNEKKVSVLKGTKGEAKGEYDLPKK